MIIFISITTLNYRRKKNVHQNLTVNILKAKNIGYIKPISFFNVAALNNSLSL